MSKAQEWVDKQMAAWREYDKANGSVPSFSNFAAVKPSPDGNGEAYRVVCRLQLSDASMYPEQAIEFAKWILATFEEPK